MDAPEDSEKALKRADDVLKAMGMRQRATKKGEMAEALKNNDAVEKRDKAR